MEYNAHFLLFLLASLNVANVGLHLMPNSLAISLGSLFAGWMMHLTGRYKAMNLTLGFLPFIGAAQVYLLREDSGFWVSWFSIVRPIFFLYMFILRCFLGVILTMLCIYTGPARVRKRGGVADDVEYVCPSIVKYPKY